MAKIHKLQNNILQFEFFTPHREFEIYWNKFLSTELGRIYQAIPWRELVRYFRKKSFETRGNKSTFDLQGKLALMFLKAYTQSSDKRLMERLGSDYNLQFFCGVYFRADEKVPGFKIISDIRSELSGRLNLPEAQQILAKAWSPYMHNTQVLLTDATCYESELRYPTEVKLLWECCEWTYGQIKRMCKGLKCHMPRSKYAEQKVKYLNYQRSRKKTHKHKQKRIRSLLYLLNKFNSQLDELQASLPENISMPQRYYRRIETIKTVYVQQKQLFETGERSKRMIVSIAKSYLRPIVRGKETKRVEFGAKVNMIQIDGINFIEHLSFDAFHEGKRLISSIWLGRQLFGRCTHIGADAIYATNANRRDCSKRNITTSFVRKGKPAKDEPQRKQMRSILSKARATRMEGSFGVEKNHYSLQRVKARTKANEVLWIFFGVHTANAVNIARRMSAETVPKGQAA